MWQAAAVSAWLDGLLAEGAGGRVHSVFQRAVNLEFSGELAALQDAALGNAPLAITLTPPPQGFAALGWAPGDPVRVRSGFLWVGGAAICLAAPRWDPLAPCPPVAPDRALARANAARLAQFLSARGSRDGLLAAALAPAAPAAALLQGDFAGAVPALVGLGAGLTPAGDDLVAGFLATLVLGRAEVPAAALAQAARAQTGRTTELAAAMLRAAARGGLPERLGLLLGDLLRVPGPVALRHGSGALALGHSSGTDLCCGLLLGLQWLSGG